MRHRHRAVHRPATGELLALTREDVDLPGRRLNVRATLTEVNGRTPRLRREEPKSRAGYRQVPIVEALAVRLQAHLDTLGPTDEGAVFASPVGTWMSKSNFYRDAWKPTRTAAGRPELTFHDLRHTAASLLLAYSGAELAEQAARARLPGKGRHPAGKTWPP